MTSRNRSSSSSSTSPSSRPKNQSTASDVAQDMRAKTGEAISKVSDAAQQAGSQAKDAAASLASDAGQKAKGFLNMQVASGSDLAGHVARSVRSAADSLDPNAPQLASLAPVRPSAWSSFRETGRGQTVEDLVRTASESTRRQPALVFNWLPSQASSRSACSRAAALGPERITLRKEAALATTAARNPSAAERDNSMAPTICRSLISDGTTEVGNL